MRIIIPRNYDEPSKTGNYVLLLQNNASRQVYVFKRLCNLSMNPLCYELDVKMNKTAQPGEYTYYLIHDPMPELIPNNRYFIAAVESYDSQFSHMSAAPRAQKYQDVDRDSLDERDKWGFIYDAATGLYQIYGTYDNDSMTLSTTPGSTNLKRNGGGTWFQIQRTDRSFINDQPIYTIAFHSDRPTRYIGYNASSPRYAMYMAGYSDLYTELTITDIDVAPNYITTNSQPLLSEVKQPDGKTVLLRDLRPEIGLFMYNVSDGKADIVHPHGQQSFLYYGKKE